MSSVNKIADLSLYIDHTDEIVLDGTLSEIVEWDKNVLEIGLGYNSSLNSVVFDLIFPSIGEFYSDITWDASAHSQIDNEGIVTQGVSDVTANIVATITKYSESDTKTFSVTVLSE